jgi:hypothetical protein
MLYQAPDVILITQVIKRCAYTLQAPPFSPIQLDRLNVRIGPHVFVMSAAELYGVPEAGFSDSLVNKNRTILVFWCSDVLGCC